MTRREITPINYTDHYLRLRLKNVKEILYPECEITYDIQSDGVAIPILRYPARLGPIHLVFDLCIILYYSLHIKED